MLTFPIPLRFLFAARPEVLNNVLAVVQRGISSFIVRQAGLQVSSGARTGAVTLIQRFGSALNLNVHLHMLFIAMGSTPSAGGAQCFNVPGGLRNWNWPSCSTHSAGAGYPFIPLVGSSWGMPPV